VRIEVAVDVAAPRERVWALLVHWERQAEWMVDARAVEVLTPARAGIGVTVRCPTGVLGFTVEDVLRVTRWEPPAVLAMIHIGDLIVGEGTFELTPLDARSGVGTRVTWREQLEPPLGAIGALGAATFVAPIVRWLFRRSLRNLSALAEGEARPA
jgi:uncharacterized protein YndB with AHSA1/START domain